MKRSTNCRTCGSIIRPRAKDMSLGAAVRKHYWAKHPEVMRPNLAESEWSKAKSSKRK